MADYLKNISRRNFIALGGMVIGSITAACARKDSPAPEGAQSYEFPEDIPYAGFRVGVQTWCFRDSKSLDTVIDYLHTLCLAHVEIAPAVAKLMAKKLKKGKKWQKEQVKLFNNKAKNYLI